MSPENTFYMEVLITRRYALVHGFCSFKMFPIVCVGLTDELVWLHNLILNSTTCTLRVHAGTQTYLDVGLEPEAVVPGVLKGLQRRLIEPLEQLSLHTEEGRKWTEVINTNPAHNHTLQLDDSLGYSRRNQGS